MFYLAKRFGERGCFPGAKKTLSRAPEETCAASSSGAPAKKEHAQKTEQKKDPEYFLQEIQEERTFNLALVRTQELMPSNKIESVQTTTSCARIPKGYKNFGLQGEKASVTKEKAAARQEVMPMEKVDPVESAPNFASSVKISNDTDLQANAELKSESSTAQKAQPQKWSTVRQQFLSIKKFDSVESTNDQSSQRISSNADVKTEKDSNLANVPAKESPMAVLQKEAFRAVVKDDESALLTALEDVAAPVWSKWTNKAGSSLLQLAEDRVRRQCLHRMKVFLGLSKEARKIELEVLREGAAVWVTIPGSIAPEQASVISFTEEQAYVRFWCDLPDEDVDRCRLSLMARQAGV